MLNRLSSVYLAVTALARFSPIALVLFLFGCGGGSSHSTFVTPPPIPVPNSKSAGLFGLHIQSLATPLPTIGFGEVRIWSNVDSARWAKMDTTPGSPPNFNVLDKFLADFYTAGVTDVVYTVGQVPQWASTNPNDTSCDFAVPTDPTSLGGCNFPADLKPDGSGTDQTYINFITAIAEHVNDPTYLQTHARIKYWEPWNEWYRNPVVSPYPWDHYSIHASYAQMVRMVQDLRCTITGKGSINGVPCTPIDSTALIVSPSSGANSCCSAPQVFQNFLYCNGTGPNAPIPGSACTTGTAGSAAVDVINSHWYEPAALGAEPEDLLKDVPLYTSLLSPTDQAKPLWSDEGSWGINTAISDPDMQASWVARYYLSGWSAGLERLYWYAYDTQYGTLWSSSGGLDAAGEAYGKAYKWIVGSTLTKPCSSIGTVWTCSLTLANGNSTLVIWDTAQSCLSGICTSAVQSVSSTYANYQDLAGTNHPIGTLGTVSVGIKPILLTASAGVAP